MQDVLMNFFSPCRPHPCSPEHAAVVLAWREVREAWEREAERNTGGYVADLMTYVQSFPRPQLGEFLKQYHRERRAASGSQEGGSP